MPAHDQAGYCYKFGPTLLQTWYNKPLRANALEPPAVVTPHERPIFSAPKFFHGSGNFGLQISEVEISGCRFPKWKFRAADFRSVKSGLDHSSLKG